MAVRIQFRRGTAAEWALANPTLAAGELGYETDTTKFKLGDGTTNWAGITYAGVTQSDIEAAVAGVVGLAPEDLNTLVELASAVGNDPDFFNTVSIAMTSLDSHIADHTDVHGIANTLALETQTGAQTKANNAQANAASYTDNAIAGLIDSAPGTLNTLNELAAALGDDANYASTVSTALGHKINFVIDTAANFAAANVITTVNTLYIESDHSGFVRVGDGVSHYNSLAFIGKIYTDSLVNDHANLDINVHGISNTANLAYKVDVQNAASTAANNLSSHTSATLNVHGIGNTANLVMQTDLSGAISAHSSETTSIHGIANTALLATHSDLDTHAIDTLDVHGIANTQLLVTQSDLTAHSDDTTAIHGIANTALLVVQSDLDVYAYLNAPTFTGAVVLPTTTTIGNVSATELSYVDGVTSSIQSQLDAKLASATAAATYAPLANATLTGTVTLPSTTSIGAVSATELGYVDGVTSSIQTQIDSKAPIASPSFTGTVSGVTKAMVGLGNVDNTSDANKPISSATQTALDLKAPIANATLTGLTTTAALTVTGNLVVNGTTTTVSSSNLEVTDPLIYIGTGNSANTKDLGLIGHFNDGTYQHTGIVRDATDGKWKLFSGVVAEATDTVDFTTWTKDTLVLGALEATTVTPSAGVVFSDGTQTKQGVPSISSFTYKTASYTLDALTLRDGIIEVANTSATTVTIPADNSVNYPIGSSIDILQTSTGQVTIAGAAGVTVNATPGLKLRTQWSSATLLKRAANTWIVYGDLTA